MGSHQGNSSPAVQLSRIVCQGGKGAFFPGAGGRLGRLVGEPRASLFIQFSNLSLCLYAELPSMSNLQLLPVCCQTAAKVSKFGRNRQGLEDREKLMVAEQ